MAESLKPLVYSLHDSLMLLAPPGWSQVELKLVEHHGALHLAELETKGVGAKNPRPRPELHVEPKEEAGRFAEAVGELRHQLSHAGRSWPGLGIRVERTAEFADWKLLQPDGAVEWFTRLDRPELDQLLITDALFDAVAGTQRAFAEQQGRFETRFGGAQGFHFDEARATLELLRGESREAVPVQLVGTYLPQEFLWVWGWAEEGGASDRVRQICEPEVESAGLGAFWRDHFHCEEGFAWELAGHITVSLGARGLFRAESGRQVQVFAVLG